MAQIDSNATKEQLAQMEREFARKRAEAARRRAHELARLSERRAFLDGRSTLWTYVTVDGSFVRILSCENAPLLLEVPDEIEGLPVRELAAEALSGLGRTEEIVCAPSIHSIGPYAFRGCENLGRLVLPTRADTVLSSWTVGCTRLEELWLPDALEAIGSEALSNPAVKILVVGSGTSFVDPSAFEKMRLQEIRIAEGNVHLMTDGACVYSADRTLLFAIARETGSYNVLPGCRFIGKKAFSGAGALGHVGLPEGVESIGPLAFARSGVTSIECPGSLLEIDDKAFLRCRSLRSIRLNAGLRAIGDDAFSGSALETLHVPETVRSIGRSIAEHTNVRFSGDDATFTVDGGNRTYFVNREGCLYRRGDDGIHLVQMLDPEATRCHIEQGTVGIDEKACAYHAALETVEIPQGVRRIGDGAFRVCRKLRRASVPDTLESMGAEAFIDTALEQFRVPAALVDIGPRALVTDGAHHEGPLPALREIDVDVGNERFFMHDGMLCRRHAERASVVVFTSSCANVGFPDDIEEVEDYAFNNAFGIEELRLNARLRAIGACGLSVMSQIRHVRIDVAQPIEGRSSFDLRFPATTHSVHGFLLALGGMGYLHLPDIMAQYDSCIASSRNYRAPRSSDNASAYEQSKLIVARLRDATLLTESNRKRYQVLIEDNLEEICVDIARHDDRATLGALMDLGFVNEGTIERVIAAVGRLQDAAMTAYLLEAKRRRFGRGALDFDL